MDFYHAVNRGTEGRTIFLDSQDFARFVHNLYEMNDTLPARNISRSLASDLRSNSRGLVQLVDVHAWCLMRNHFHLLLTERVDGGMTKFLMKVNIGYAKYFNEKYHRTGTLYQGRTKKVLIERDAHYLHILNYIHLNPLDYLAGAEEWRNRMVQNANEAIEFLDEYRWSSYLDYCGVTNFPSLLSTGEFVRQDYRTELIKYLETLKPATIAAIHLE